MKSQGFKVTPFTNPSGAKAWRVSGSLHGKQIRKNFTDQVNSDGTVVKGKVLAKAFAEAKEIERLNTVRNVHTVATRLSGEQVAEAERVFDEIKPFGKSLSFVSAFFKKHYVRADVDLSLEDAVSKYTEQREKDAERGLITEAQAKRLTAEMVRFKRKFKERQLADVTLADLLDYLANGGSSLKTWNNRRGVLSTFYKHAAKENWIERNLIAEIPHHGRRAIGRKKGEAETLSADQGTALMKRLEEFKGGIMVNFFAATLFAGIRPDLKDGEISKIKPEHFDLDHGQINLPAWVSKIGETRTITIQPNYRRWLEKYPLDRFPIIPPNARKLRLEMRKEFKLGHDVLRHTFCSFLYSKTKDLGDTAMQAGNSADMIRTHYTSYKQPDEVAKFWAIEPEEKKEKIVKMRA